MECWAGTLDEIPDARLVGQAARHEAVTARRADRKICVSAIKDERVLGELVEVGRDHVSLTVSFVQLWAQVIGDQEQHVLRAGRRVDIEEKPAEVRQHVGMITHSRRASSQQRDLHQDS